MSEVVTGDAVVLDVQIAQLPVRAVSAIIDITRDLRRLHPRSDAVGGSLTQFDEALTVAFLIIFTVLAMVGYPVAIETATRGRSVGKMVMGLRVVSDDGGPERFRQAMFRALASVVEIWMLFGSPAVICSVLSPKAKRIGDMFAGTVVVSERGPRLGPPPAMPPTAGGVGVVVAAVRADRRARPRWRVNSSPGQHNSIRSCASRWHTGSPVTWCPASRRHRHRAFRRNWSWPRSLPNATVANWLDFMPTSRAWRLRWARQCQDRGRQPRVGRSHTRGRRSSNSVPWPEQQAPQPAPTRAPAASRRRADFSLPVLLRDGGREDGDVGGQQRQPPNGTAMPARRFAVKTEATMTKRATSGRRRRTRRRN